MPNWCSNDLYLRGRASEVKKVLESVKNSETDSPFDFNKILPYPEPYATMDREANAFSIFSDDARAKTNEEREKARREYIAKWGSDKDGYNFGGYEWCSKTWGTKWNAARPNLKINRTGSAKITFETAWSPPVPIIEALSLKFPNVTFKLNWFEQGMAQQGTFTYTDGIVSDETQKEYHGNRGG